MAEDGGSNWMAWGIPLIVIGCLLLIFLILFFVRRYIRGPMYKGQAVDMTGKTVLITGGNTGIGKETAKDLAKRGAKVVILCRNTDKGNTAAKEISEETGTAVGVQKLDLSSFDSIRECAALLKEQEPKIHVLINNAGVMTCPEWKTKDGLEMQIGTNHFGHFLLTLLLLDNIKAAAPSRIVTVSSIGHKTGEINWEDVNLTKSYAPLKAYTQSKLANVLFSNSLGRKLKGTQVTTYSLHPGAVQTELTRHIGSVYGSVLNAIASRVFPLFIKTPLLGAQTSIACAVDVKLGNDTGKYYNDCKEDPVSTNGRNEQDADRFWELSLDTVGMKDFQV